MIKRILNIVGWVGTALVFAAVVVSRVPTFSNYGQYAKPLAIAGLVCVLAYTAGQWREIAQMFSRRQARYGTLAATAVLVVLGILIAVNYIGARQNKRWDLTAAKQYGLSDQSRNVIAKLDAPLRVQVFAMPSDFPRYQERMREYEYNSKNITTEYIDPDKQPTLAKQNQIQQYGTILLSFKGRTQTLTSDSEQDVTNGIIKVVTGQQKKIYFSDGHGERDTTSSDRAGYGTIVGALGRENYTVEKLVVAQQSSVPDDAAVIVVAGPQIDFLANEIDVLKKYLDKGGKLLLQLDPPDKPTTQAAANLIGLSHDWAIDVGNDIVFDLASRVGDATVPVAASYPPHAITERFRLMTAFPLARSVSPTSSPVNGRTAQSIVMTGQRSWADIDVQGILSGKEPEYTDGKDKKGPVSIASAVSAAVGTPPPTSTDGAGPKPETRVVVIGDSDFASNALLGIAGNRDLYMNIIGWLSQQENLISIRPKEPDDRRLSMTTSDVQFMFLLSVLVIPACIFGTGIFSWWRRR